MVQKYFFLSPLRGVHVKTTIPKKPWRLNQEVVASCHPVYVDVDMELAVFLLKNADYTFRHPRLRMTCSGRVFFLLFFFTLVVFPCAPERVKSQKPLVVRQRDGGEDITHNDDDTQGGQQQGLTKSDSVGSEEETKADDPLSGRSELTNTYPNPPLLRS